jgi:hypothetical protein
MSWIYDDESLPVKDNDPNPIPPGMESVYYGKADWDAKKLALEDTRAAFRAGKGLGFAPLAARPTITGVSRLLWLKNDNRWQLYNGTIDDPIVTDSVLSTQLASYVPTSRTLTAGTGLTGGGDLSANRSIALADTAVTPGIYTAANITVDQQGRITAAASGSGVTAPLTLAVDDTNLASFPLVLRHTDSDSGGGAGLEVGLSFQIEEATGGGTPNAATIRAVLTDATASSVDAYLTMGAAAAGTVGYPVRVYGDGLAVAVDGLTYVDRTVWPYGLIVATTDDDSSKGILLINEDVAPESDTERSPEMTFAWHATRYEESGPGIDSVRAMSLWGESIDGGATDIKMDPAMWIGSDPTKPVLRVSDDGLNPGAGQLAVFYDASSTDSAPDLLRLRRTTSGTAAAGIGASILLEAEDAGGAVQDAGRISSVLAVATAGSEKGYMSLSATDGAGALATTLAAWGTARIGLGALGVTEPSATVHARSEASAAAATPVLRLEKQSGSALANNRLAEWYRDGSTVLGFIQSDASDNLAISAAANKAVIFAVNGVTQASVTNTVTTVNGAFRHAGSTLAFFSATAVARSATPFTLNSGTLAHDLPATGNTADGVAHVLRQLLTYLGDVSGYGLINVTA